VGGDDNKVHVYRLEAEGGGFAFQDVTVLPGASAVSALAYSPTGDKIAVGYLGRQIEVLLCGNDAYLNNSLLIVLYVRIY